MILVVLLFFECFVVVCFICCYVVKLAKAKKATPQKVEVLPCILNMASYVCMCKSFCFFGVVSLGFFAFLVPKHYKNKGF